MKLSKELNEALEAVSKEVDSWPAWKRSVDMQDLNNPTQDSQTAEPAIEDQWKKRRRLSDRQKEILGQIWDRQP